MTAGWLLNARLIKPTAQTRSRSFKRLVLSLGLCSSALVVQDDARAALGDKLAEYSFPASSFVMHPTQPYMYAAIPAQNSIAIINTNTSRLNAQYSSDLAQPISRSLQMAR